MLNYNDIINVSEKYLEISNSVAQDVDILETFTKNIIYPFLCNFTGRQFHLVINDGYCTGTNTLNTIEIANGSNTNDFYNGLYLEIFAGLLSGTRRKILDYDGVTHIATLDSALSALPDASSRYCIFVDSNDTFIVSANVFVDNEFIFPPAQNTPIRQVLSPNYITNVSENVLRLDTEQYELGHIYNINYIYGFFNYLKDVESIIVMVLQDFWKRKGKRGLQGLASRTLNLEDTIVEQNYLKEIFTTAYKQQIAKYIVPFDKRSWS